MSFSYSHRCLVVSLLIEFALCLFSSFVINLESRLDRLQEFRLQSERENFSFVRVPAIDCHQAESSLARKIVALDEGFRDPTTARRMKLGEVGCALSHVSTWALIAALRDPSAFAVVFEDDAAVVHNFVTELENVLAVVPDDVGFVYLAYRDDGGEIINDLLQGCTKTWWATAYMLRVSAARTLVANREAYLQSLIPIDDYYPAILSENYCQEGTCEAKFAKSRLRCAKVRHRLAAPRVGLLSDTEHSEIAPVVDSLVTVLIHVDSTEHFGTETLMRSAKTFGYSWLAIRRTHDRIHDLLHLREKLSAMPAGRIVLLTRSNRSVLQVGCAALVERWQTFNTTVLVAAKSGGPDAVAMIGTSQSLAFIISSFVAFDSDDHALQSRMWQREADVSVRVDHSGLLFQNMTNLDKTLWSCKHPHYAFERDGHLPAFVYGDASNSFVSLSNYAAAAFRPFYGFTRHVRQTVVLRRIAIGLFIGKSAFRREFLQSVRALEVSDFDELFTHRLPNAEALLLGDSWKRHELRDDDDESTAKSIFLELAHERQCDFALLLDSDVILMRSDLVTELTQWNKSIVSAHSQRYRSLWSNYWTGMTPDGWYERSFDTVDLYQRKRVGLFQVTFARAIVLVRRDVFPFLSSSYRRNSGKGHDLARRVAVDALHVGVPMYVDNRHEFGRLLASEEALNPSSEHPELFESERDPDLWAARFLVEPVSADSVFEEVCPDAFGARFFSDEFCESLIAEAEKCDCWSSGAHDDTRLRSGYENVPTQDIHLVQIGWASQWASILNQFIQPHIRKFYTGVSLLRPVSLAFVVRYSMFGQRKLEPHNDASHVTTTVVLNSAFEGGGVYFTRYNCTHVSREPGFLLMHPGRVTHNHEAHAITNGTRYVLVSFNE